MSFIELLVVALVGLLVIGPERLPDTIRTCAVWINRAKRMITSTRAEVEQQLGMDELRRELHNEEVLQSLSAMKAKTEGKSDYTPRSAGEIVADVNRRLHEQAEEEKLMGDQKTNHPEKNSDA